MITHDLGVVAGICERVEVMYAGHVRRDAAPPTQIFAAPRHPYTLGLLAERAAARRAAARSRCTRSRASPRNMLERADARARSRRAAATAIERCDAELPLLERARAPGTRAACFNPVAPDEWRQTRLGGEAA